MSAFWSILGTVPSYRGPLAPWHVNTGPQEGRNDDSAKAREFEKSPSQADGFGVVLDSYKNFWWSLGVNEHSSDQGTPPPWSHNSFKCFGGSPEAHNPMGVIKEVKFKSRPIRIYTRQIWIGPNSSRQHQTNLDRSGIILDRSRNVRQPLFEHFIALFIYGMFLSFVRTFVTY